MELSRASLFVKYAYLPERFGSKGIPERTNVCALFWRVTIGTPLACLTMGALFVAFSPIFALAALAAYISKKREGRTITMPAPVRLVGQRLRDWKNKTCTVVDLK